MDWIQKARSSYQGMRNLKKHVNISSQPKWTKWHTESFELKRLLLLAPLLLTSCAARHDLMSDEPFQMRCQDWFIRYTVSQPGYMIGGAKLPHAQTRMWDGSYMSMWERIETTQEKITFKEDLNSQASWALQINRLTKEVIEGEWSDSDKKIIGGSPLKCSFKPLNLRFGWGSWAQVWP